MKYCIPLISGKPTSPQVEFLGNGVNFFQIALGAQKPIFQFLFQISTLFVRGSSVLPELV